MAPVLARWLFEPKVPVLKLSSSGGVLKLRTSDALPSDHSTNYRLVPFPLTTSCELIGDHRHGVHDSHGPDNLIQLPVLCHDWRIVLLSPGGWELNMKEAVFSPAMVVAAVVDG